MTDLNTIQVGDLLKTTYAKESGWLLVKIIDLKGQVVYGNFLPAMSTGQRADVAVSYSAEELTFSPLVRHTHKVTTVVDALESAIGLRSAPILLKELRPMDVRAVAAVDTPIKDVVDTPAP